MLKPQYIEAKSILNKSKLEKVDYTINPYIGCEFACKYCYASYMSNFVKEKNEDWGKFVYVKKNAPELLDKSLRKLEREFKTPSIMISSATDPYQHIEAQEKLTQKILEKFVEYDFKGKIVCLTKSPLVLRDLNIIKEIENITINFSISNNNKKIKDFFEPDVPSIKSRLKALEILNRNNIKTSVFIAPILPYYKNHIDELEELIISIKNTVTNNVIYDLLNLHGNMDRYRNCFKNSKQGQVLYLEECNSIEYREKMNKKMKELLFKYNLING